MAVLDQYFERHPYRCLGAREFSMPVVEQDY